METRVTVFGMNETVFDDTQVGVSTREQLK